MVTYGDHVLVCDMGNERTLRYNAIRDLIANLRVEAGLVTTKEEQPAPLPYSSRN